MQKHRYDTLTNEIRLALRHSGLPPESPLLFELVCGLEVKDKHILIGDHDWIHKLRCDIILAEVVAGTPSRLPFEVGLQRAAVSDQKCEKNCPIMRSEAMFMISLV